MLNSGSSPGMVGAADYRDANVCGMLLFVLFYCCSIGLLLGTLCLQNFPFRIIIVADFEIILVTYSINEKAC